MEEIDLFVFVQMHSLGFVDPEDMNVTSGKRKYSSMVGYSSSKLAQVQPNTCLNFSSHCLGIH